jgi:hypothetical protein
MGFLDKVKAQASELAKQGQGLAKQGQDKLDDYQAKKEADRMLRDLGAWYYATETARDDGDGPTEMARLVAALEAHEAEHGPLGAEDDEPSDAAAPSPPPSTPPPPPPSAPPSAPPQAGPPPAGPDVAPPS